MDFITKLKCYRRMLNLTQTAVADAMGIDRSTYAYYETGKTLPSSDGIRKLSEIFSIPVSYLMDLKSLQEPQAKYDKLVLADSALDSSELAPLSEEDATFPLLAADEKELLIRYRMKKATKGKEGLNEDEITALLNGFDYI